MNARSALLLLMISLPLAACGVKGPLYLPPSDAAMEGLPEPPVDEDLDDGLDAEDEAVLDDFDVDDEIENEDDGGDMDDGETGRP